MHAMYFSSFVALTVDIHDDATDGSYLIAVDSYGYIWKHSAAEWFPLIKAGVQPWSCVSTDADGSILAVGVEYGPIFFSQDFGENWVQEISGGFQNWTAIDISQEGTKGVAVAYGDYIYSINAPGGK